MFSRGDSASEMAVTAMFWRARTSALLKLETSNAQHATSLKELFEIGSRHRHAVGNASHE